MADGVRATAMLRSDTDMGPTNSNYQVDLNEDSDPINWDGKLDWNISSRDLATFRVDYQHIINTFLAPLGPILDGIGSNQGHTPELFELELHVRRDAHLLAHADQRIPFRLQLGQRPEPAVQRQRQHLGQLRIERRAVQRGSQNGGLPAISTSLASLRSPRQRSGP